MKTFRGGMTLFELLIVMTVIGIVYSIGLFTLKKEKVTVSSMNVMNIKSTLASLEHSGEIRMVCGESCQECRVYSVDDTLLATFRFQSDGTPMRYGFDQFGELKPLGAIVTRTGGELRQGCFEVSLHPDGTLSPLILKSKQTFYGYTPLGEDKPFVAKSEDALRQLLFNEANAPLKLDDYYGAQ